MICTLIHSRDLYLNDSREVIEVLLNSFSNNFISFSKLQYSYDIISLLRSANPLIPLHSSFIKSRHYFSSYMFYCGSCFSTGKFLVDPSDQSEFSVNQPCRIIRIWRTLPDSEEGRSQACSGTLSIPHHHDQRNSAIHNFSWTEHSMLWFITVVIGKGINVNIYTVKFLRLFRDYSVL